MGNEDRPRLKGCLACERRFEGRDWMYAVVMRVECGLIKAGLSLCAGGSLPATAYELVITV